MKREDFDSEEAYLAYRHKYTRHNRRYYGKIRDADNVATQWSPSEDERVLRKDVPDTDLAMELGRTIGSIQKRRWALKKLRLAQIPHAEGEEQ